ncbi:hypothetical protein DRQ11_15060, partial [candidate division KSB1 bacterium]
MGKQGILEAELQLQRKVSRRSLEERDVVLGAVSIEEVYADVLEGPLRHAAGSPDDGPSLYLALPAQVVVEGDGHEASIYLFFGVAQPALELDPAVSGFQPDVIVISEQGVDPSRGLAGEGFGYGKLPDISPPLPFLTNSEPHGIDWPELDGSLYSVVPEAIGVIFPHIYVSPGDEEP